jgi:hypothetical protein
MQNADQPDDMQETDSNAPPTPSEEGYSITIEVTPSGFSVSGPHPIPPHSEADEEETELPDITSAIKEVLAIVKENPANQDEQAHFSAGYDKGR